MPTGTFFRLPEEKRSRLMEVAWEEFSNTPYAKVSINRIIQAAQIPRGSFYQYFADKEELFLYMVESLQNSLKEKLTQCLEQGEGDLFQLPMRIMDWAEGGEGELDPQVRRFARIVGMNQGTDVFQFLPRPERLLPEDVMARVNTAQLRRDDPEFLEDIFFFMVSAMGYTLMEILRTPERAAALREQLRQRIELLRLGCAKPAEPAAHSEEETP